ncbi:GNAT family N-acetyltransferase [Furfurilactobacillus siliginis]|nr:GNAT family protein [Furfurilactobacillus siliginis]GEK29282.1 hypothetical protein LSI01_15930 [Furfurilactobacillus siliginis]
MKDVLRGNKVYLSHQRAGDAEYIARYQWADGSARNSEWDVSHIREPEFFRKMLSGSNYDAFIFVIRRLSDDAPLGWIELQDVSAQHQTAELGITISDPQMRGQGFGVDAINCLLAFAFFEMNLFKVRLEFNANNPAAAKAYTKVGFKTETIERQALYLDGRWFDRQIAAIFSADWQATHQDWPEFSEVSR